MFCPGNGMAVDSCAGVNARFERPRAGSPAVALAGANTELAVGTEVTVEGYPSTAEPGELRAERIRLNGRSVELR